MVTMRIASFFAKRAGWGEIGVIEKRQAELPVKRRRQ
jgi:hypothetical protein